MAEVNNDADITTVEDVETQELENSAWTVGRKFLVSIIISIALLVVAIFVSVYYYIQIVDLARHTSGHTYVIRERAMTLKSHLKDYEYKVKEYGRTGDLIEQSAINDYKQEIGNSLTLLDQEIDRTDSVEKNTFQKLKDKINEALKFGNEYVTGVTIENMDNGGGATPTTSTSLGVDPLGDIGGVDDPLASPGSADPLGGDLDDPLPSIGADPLGDLGGLDDPLPASDPLGDLGGLDDPLGDVGDPFGDDLGGLDDPLPTVGDADPLGDLDLTGGSDPLADLDDGGTTSGDGGADGGLDIGFDLTQEAFGNELGGGSSVQSSLSTQEMDLSLLEVYEIIENQIIRSSDDVLISEMNDIDDYFFYARLLIIGILCALIAFNVGQYFYFQRSVTNPIKSLRRYLLSMGKGELPEFKMKVWRDDIGEMVRALKNLLIGLKQTAVFAKELGSGNLEAEYSLLSKNDILGNSLMSMRDNLRKLADDDEKRNWVNQGVASFAEILRTNNDNLEMLSDQIVLYLVNYLKVNQGGLFLINDIDKKDVHLELAAVYAWDRRKFVERKIEKGQGLVGQCWYEQKTIFMTDVPQNFVQITSGLGEATPRCILIVPLISNEEIYGVMEFASFNTLQEYEIDFVEKVAESIAAAIGNVRITERTKNLLEEAQQQGEELRANEEEMRQNMEEMNATQEEMDRIIQEKDVQIERLTAELEELKGNLGAGS